MPGRLSNQQLTVESKTAIDELGAVYVDAFGRMFRYVKFNVATAKGDCMHIDSTATGAGAQGRGWRVAAAASAANSRRVVGVAIMVNTASYYGWIQCGGPLGTFGNLTTQVKTNKSVAAGDLIYKSTATAAMTLKNPATGSTAGFTIGLALGSDSGSFLVAGTIVDRFGT